MCSAGKLVMFAVLLVLFTAVSGECEEKCHCSKYKVFCSVARLGALPTRIPNTTELVKIELDNIRTINSTTGLENITHLQIVRVGLWEIEPGAFQNMSRLEYLAITDNNILLLKANSFKYLLELYFLNLSRNEFHYLTPGTFSGLQKLRILDLRRNFLTILGETLFQGMKSREINAVEYENLFRHTVIDPGAFRYLSTLTYFYLSQINAANNIPKHVSFGVSMSFAGTEYVNRNNRTAISELLSLQLPHFSLQYLKEIKFDNFTKLRYLDLSHNRISEIECGYFEGLVSLQILKMNHNFIKNLNNTTFYGLQSLEMLNISSCHVLKIESRAFEGLFKLQILDLSRNKFDTLLKSTFSTLPMLKEIIMEGNTITHIDSGCFGDFSNLKSLLNSARTVCEIEHLKSINAVNEKAFVQLQRLDNLRLFLHITIPKEIQVLNALHLNINGAYDDPQKELRRVLQTVHYVRSLSVAVWRANSTEFLGTLSQFHVSKLIMSFTHSVSLNRTNLCRLPALRTLTVYLRENLTIEEGAFRGFNKLEKLCLIYNFNFAITYGLFLGLENLKHLNIKSSNCNEYSSKNWNIKYIDSGVFLGMDNLKELHLGGNYLTHLKPGAFEGLNKIEKMDLSKNRIRKIEAGVFGAICKGEFETSCKNVTLPEYCNNTNALKTLKYLNLYRNNISHIHPHAFVSCTNLQTLVLSRNCFLTLDNPFLYTPGLRRLYMSSCNITNIPNDTFACTPLLSQINFNDNEELNKLKLSVLLPLRHLQNIYFVETDISYDCELYETWVWLRQHNVDFYTYHYSEEMFYDDDYQRITYADYYYFKNKFDANVPKMTCNGTTTNISVPQNRTSDPYDFAFFKQYVEPIVLIIVLTFGLVSNGFLLFIALRHSDMRTKHNACIIHLSTVELLSLVLNLPLSYWDVVNVRWEFDDTLCKIFIFSKDVGVAVTAFSTIALSVERFLVARTFQNLRKMCKSEKQPTAWLLLMTWFSGIVCSLPAYFFAGVIEGRCLYCPPGNQSYIRNVWTFQFVMYCILPAFAISFLNVKTCLFLRASIRKIPGEIKENDRVKNRRKVANVALILVVVFIVSYLPNYMLRLLVAWSLVDMKDLFLPSFFTFCLFFCYPIFNPISVFIMSSKFKSYAFRYFPFLENVQHSSSVPHILDGNVRRHKKSGG